MEFVYPSEMFNNKKVDASYEEEFNLISENFKTYLIDIDNLQNARAIQTQDTVIYRGWMLAQDEYQLLEKKLMNTNGQSALLINTAQYLSSHYLPNWYDTLKDLTIESIITTTEQAKKEMLAHGWTQAFVKDYVKSLKTGQGSVAISPDDLNRVFEDMITYRGKIEGGIVLRHVMDILPEMEKRYFILNDRVFSPDNATFALDLVEQVRDRLLGTRFFYSVDVSQTKEGKALVIEIGDGQVSDFVGWNLRDFTLIFDTLKQETKKNLKI